MQFIVIEPFKRIHNQDNDTTRYVNADCQNFEDKYPARQETDNVYTITDSGHFDEQENGRIINSAWTRIYTKENTDPRYRTIIVKGDPELSIDKTLRKVNSDCLNFVLRPRWDGQAITSPVSTFTKAQWLPYVMAKIGRFCSKFFEERARYSDLTEFTVWGQRVNTALRILSKHNYGDTTPINNRSSTSTDIEYEKALDEIFQTEAKVYGLSDVELARKIYSYSLKWIRLVGKLDELKAKSIMYVSQKENYLEAIGFEQEYESELETLIREAQILNFSEARSNFIQPAIDSTDDTDVPRPSRGGSFGLDINKYA